MSFARRWKQHYQGIVFRFNAPSHHSLPCVWRRFSQHTGLPSSSPRRPRRQRATSAIDRHVARVPLCLIVALIYYPRRRSVIVSVQTVRRYRQVRPSETTTTADRSFAWVSGIHSDATSLSLYAVGHTQIYEDENYIIHSTRYSQLRQLTSVTAYSDCTDYSATS